MTKTPVETEHGTRVGDVEFIWARNSKEFLFANSIYIHGSKPIIVDPSASFTYIEELAQSHAVHTVLNTHYHGDHRSLNGLFKNVIFAAHKLDAPAIRDYQTYEKFADPNPDSIYSEWRKQFFYQYKIHDCPVSQLLEGDETLDSGGTPVEMVHIPGHTPGHMALFFPEIDCLYLSDIDLTPYGPWYANIVSNIDQFKASVKKVKEWKASVYVSSHGERLYTPEQFQEKIDRFYRHFDERDERILEILKQGPKEFPHLASEGIIYKKMALSDPLKAYFQWQMLEKHLESLISQGKVKMEGNLYFLNN